MSSASRMQERQSYAGMPVVCGNASRMRECQSYAGMPVVCGNASRMRECRSYAGMPVAWTICPRRSTLDDQPDTLVERAHSIQVSSDIKGSFLVSGTQRNDGKARSGKTDDKRGQTRTNACGFCGSRILPSIPWRCNSDQRFAIADLRAASNSSPGFHFGM